MKAAVVIGARSIKVEGRWSLVVGRWYVLAGAKAEAESYTTP